MKLNTENAVAKALARLPSMKIFIAPLDGTSQKLPIDDLKWIGPLQASVGDQAPADPDETLSPAELLPVAAHHDFKDPEDWDSSLK